VASFDRRGQYIISGNSKGNVSTIIFVKDCTLIVNLCQLVLNILIVFVSCLFVLLLQMVIVDAKTLEVCISCGYNMLVSCVLIMVLIGAFTYNSASYLRLCPNY